MQELKIDSQLLRRGAIVFAGLLVLTALEFAVAVSTLPGILLLALVLAKAALILIYYMHVRDLRNLDEEGGH